MTPHRLAQEGRIAQNPTTNGRVIHGEPPLQYDLFHVAITAENGGTSERTARCLNLENDFL